MSLPIIGINNLFADGTVTASNEGTGFEAENAADGFTYDFWRPTQVGSPISTSEWLSTTLTTTQAADYFAIAAHTMADVGASVKPQYWDGADWQDADLATTPTDNAPFLVTFSSQSSADWRLLFENYTADFSIGVAHIGTRTTLQRGMPLTWTPPTKANEKAQASNAMAVGGQIVGRTITRRQATAKVIQNNITRAWFDSTWLGLVADAQTKPLFFRWSEDHDDTIYGGMMGDPSAAYAQADLMNVSFSIEGIVR